MTDQAGHRMTQSLHRRNVTGDGMGGWIRFHFDSIIVQGKIDRELAGLVRRICHGVMMLVQWLECWSEWKGILDDRSLSCLNSLYTPTSRRSAGPSLVFSQDNVVFLRKRSDGYLSPSLIPGMKWSCITKVLRGVGIRETSLRAYGGPEADFKLDSSHDGIDC